MGKRSRQRGRGTAETVAAAAPEAAVALEPQAPAARLVPPAAAEPEPQPAAGADADGTDGAAESEAPAAPAAPARTPIYDARLREAIAYAEEADYLYHLLRWTVLQGRVPTARDWLGRDDMPHPDAVSEVFGSWAKFIEGSGLAESPLLARLREADARERDLEAREDRIEREGQRAADLRRQLETARRKRDDAERERDEEARRAGAAERTIADAQRRAERAEAALAERSAAAQEIVASAPEAAAEAVAAELEVVRAHREQLLSQVEQLEHDAERSRRAIAELSAALGDRTQADAADAAGPSTPEDEPKSVLEAVRIAAETCRHLVFTESAFDSAADSPYRRPAEVLDALRKLDAIAKRYLVGQMGTSLGHAALGAGITWRAGVSELARTRFARHYVVTHQGQTLDLGPHIALGSGSGAGLIARIYLHVADGNGPLPRGIYVGHVGRHLPDTTT